MSNPGCDVMKTRRLQQHLLQSRNRPTSMPIECPFWVSTNSEVPRLNLKVGFPDSGRSSYYWELL
jgi:hypothetical protein